MNINVRRATLDDVDDIFVIEQKCFTLNRFTRKDICVYARNKSAIFGVAESNKKIVGYVAGNIQKRRKVSRCVSLAVLMPWRGSGTAAKLMNYFEDLAKQNGSTYTELEVRQKNYRARAFYKKFNYELKYMLPNYYGMGVSGLKLRKVLK